MPITTTGAGGFPAIAGGSLGLQTNLTGFWSMENTSWLDDTASGTTLTAVGSPTSVSGKVGNAASVGNSANALTASSNTNIISGGGSFSAACWVNVTGGATASSIIFNKRAATFANDEWGFGVNFSTSNRWAFSCFNTSSSEFIAMGPSGTGDFASGWHLLVGTYDSSPKTVTIYVDGSSITGTATLTGTLGSSASATLNIGRTGAGTPVSNNPVLVDQAAFWKGRILSAGDVTALYNSGTGLTYAQMV